jgi:hypothetical protein
MKRRRFSMGPWRFPGGFESLFRKPFWRPYTGDLPP